MDFQYFMITASRVCTEKKLQLAGITQQSLLSKVCLVYLYILSLRYTKIAKEAGDAHYIGSVASPNKMNFECHISVVIQYPFIFKN